MLLSVRRPAGERATSVFSRAFEGTRRFCFFFQSQRTSFLFFFCFLPLRAQSPFLLFAFEICALFRGREREKTFFALSFRLEKKTTRSFFFDASSFCFSLSLSLSVCFWKTKMDLTKFFSFFEKKKTCRRKKARIQPD